MNGSIEQPCCEFMSRLLNANLPCQFTILAEKVLEQPGLAADPKFATNDARVKNRKELIDVITSTLMKHDRDYWLERFTGLGWVLRLMNVLMTDAIHAQRPIRTHQ